MRWLPFFRNTSIRDPKIKVGIACVCLLLLSACGQSDPSTSSPTPAESKYQAPPTISADSANFNGPRSNYVTTKNTDGSTTVVDKVGNDGTINLSPSIKLLVFTDVSINLEIGTKSKEINNEALNAIIELYIAYFNRVPDANGLGYWIGEYKNGMSIDKIGDSFYAAAIQYSAYTGYSPTANNAEFITIAYRNILSRTPPDKAGLDYWTERLNAGTETRGNLIRVFLAAAHGYSGDKTYGWVAQLLDNKIAVAKEFALNQGITYLSYTDTILKCIYLLESVTPTDTSIANNNISSIIGYKATTTDIPSPAQASRFLSQASFGARKADITNLSAIGINSWLNQQFSVPQKLHRSYMDSTAATLAKGVADLNQNHFLESFWQQAINGEDQLRQRVNFALSQIFVVSFQDSSVANYPRGVASYYDTLGTHAFGNFRQLLEAVSLHPMMGLYLTSLRNQKESGTQVPDENYAREVMQLFTIGLYKLNPDGSYVLINGKPVETYSNADITGLAKVFTGWSWAGTDKSSTRFFGGNPDANRDWMPMQSYPASHSVSEKSFLGTVIPPQSPANPELSLKTALDTLFNHPNLAPFFSKQLIQRLVSSNPSPQYVARVASAFANNGQGVRGDMRAVIKAIYTDVEARNDPVLSNSGLGKLREPVLRLAQWMRTFNAKSTSGFFRLTSMDDPLTSIGQTPMRSPSVFNFYRPGYVPPNSSIAIAGLVSPELQITGETSVVGYLNFMRDALPNGTGTSRDVKADYSTLTSLANTPDQLINEIDLLLTAGQMSSNLRSQILAAINSVTIPSSPASSADTARLNRVYLSIYLTMASPEYLVQK
ncbi:DUF1800 family protein [Undibacterium danionis]|uniref:DUF1800 family protein n=1 Tax=Undibacterium danionis TaxID=1812100 RepID=A0ABV6IFZ0_9BURK